MFKILLYQKFPLWNMTKDNWKWTVFCTGQVFIKPQFSEKSIRLQSEAIILLNTEIKIFTN